MKKSLSRRVKVTSTGKVMRRRSRTNHSRTRKSSTNLRAKRKLTGLDYPIKKVMSY